MNNAKMWVMITAVIFLSARWGYSEELSDSERRIYYEASLHALEAEYRLSVDPSADVEASTRQFLSQNGITEAELNDIIERGNKMAFTVAEEGLSQELNARITDNLTPDEIMDALADLSNKYGMSKGQVSSIYTRNIARD